jgi:hypothetical protein
VGLLGKHDHGQSLRPIRSKTAQAAAITLVVCLGVIIFSAWIYQGYGRFRFENTWVDVSCLFTEAYGMAFPFVVLPVFGVLTAIKKLILGQFAPANREQLEI